VSTRTRCMVVLLALTSTGAFARGDDDKPLSPVEARKKSGSKITVQMEVKAAKDRLEKRGKIYLDSEENFKDEKNFAVITKKGAARLKDAGITDPAVYFRGKTIRAQGTVTAVDGIPGNFSARRSCTCIMISLPFRPLSSRSL